MSDAKQQNARTKPLNPLFSWFIMGVVALIAADSAGFHVPGEAVFGFVLGLPVTILAHEAGHAFAAWLFRFRLVGFGVWPLYFWRVSKGWRADIWRPGTFPGAGGFVRPLPIGRDNLRKRLIYMIAAEPATSLVLGLVSALVALSAGNLKWWQQGLLIGTAFWCLSSTWTSLRFKPNPGLVNDGTHLRWLLGSTKEGERLAAIYGLAAESFEGLRPRDWDADLVRRVSGNLDATSAARTGQAIRYNWLHDTRQLDEAAKVLEWLEAQESSKGAAMIWQLERVWFDARHRRNLADARACFDRQGDLGKSPAVRCAYFKAKAAVHLLERDWDNAESAVAEVLRACDDVDELGAAAAIRAEVEQVRLEVRLARTSGNT